MRKLLIPVCVMALLVGCGKTTQFPQNTVAYTQNTNVLSLYGLDSEAQKNVLDTALAMTSREDTQVSLIIGTGVNAKQIQSVKTALVHDGYLPSEIYTNAVQEPQILDLVLTTDGLTQYEIKEKWYDRFRGRVVSSEFGKATEYNLASSYYDKKEINTPKENANASGIAAVGAVERYQKGEVRELKPQTADSIGGSSGGMGGM